MAPRSFTLFPNWLSSRLTGMVMPKIKPMQEMGASGTAIWGGYVQQKEKSSAWVGRQKYITSSDIAVNVSIVAASIHYFLNLIAHPNWIVKPASDSDPKARQMAEFVDEVMQKMTTPWYRIVRKAGMYRFHGFGVQEWTALKRDDGLIGLKDIEARPQHTIERWEVDPDGTVTGVWQRPPQTGQLIGLPRGKLLYLVDDTLTDSPEGLGIFRHLGEPYERLKQFLALEVRAYERDLRGIPVARAPITDMNLAVKANQITEAQAAQALQAVTSMVETEVRGSTTGLVLDSKPYYSQAADGQKVAGVPLWDFQLLNGPGLGLQEIAAAIERIQTEMARIMGTETMLMGAGTSSGNRSLSEDKSRNLYLVANSVLKNIASACQTDIIGALWALNGFDDDLKPELVTEDVTFKAVDQITSALQQMATAGAVLSPSDPAINDVRDLLGISHADLPTPYDLMVQGEQPAGDESIGESDANKPAPGSVPPVQPNEAPQGTPTTPTNKRKDKAPAVGMWKAWRNKQAGNKK